MNDYEKLMDSYGLDIIEVKDRRVEKTGLERLLGIDIIRV